MCVWVCVSVVSVIVKRPVLPSCVVDGRTRNLHYYYYQVLHHNHAFPESEAAKKISEESSLVTALRDTFVPRMNARDASLFATIMQDLWPHVDVPMVFGGEEVTSQPTIHPTDSLQTIKSELRIKSSKSHDSQKSLKGRSQSQLRRCGVLNE